MASTEGVAITSCYLGLADRNVPIISEHIVCRSELSVWELSGVTKTMCIEGECLYISQSDEWSAKEEG